MATRRGFRTVDDVLYDRLGVRCVAAKPRANRIDTFCCRSIFDAVNRRRVQLAQMNGVLKSCWGRCIVRSCTLKDDVVSKLLDD
jgi:hypothetical protein